MSVFVGAEDDFWDGGRMVICKIKSFSVVFGLVAVIVGFGL